MNSPAGTQALCTLRFEGRRFEQHRFDVECTVELLAYRKLVLECAKELWRRARPDRVRLPRGFEDGFRLAFDRIEEGSAALPLMRVYESPDPVQYELLDDTFDQAAALIDEAVAAADAEDLLPSALPANVVPLFGEFGRTLREDEVLYLRARGRPVEARYSAMARQRLENWVEPSYEDKVDVVGEVRMAHVGPGGSRCSYPKRARRSMGDSTSVWGQVLPLASCLANSLAWLRWRWQHEPASLHIAFPAS